MQSKNKTTTSHTIRCSSRAVPSARVRLSTSYSHIAQVADGLMHINTVAGIPSDENTKLIAFRRLHTHRENMINNNNYDDDNAAAKQTLSKTLRLRNIVHSNAITFSNRLLFIIGYPFGFVVLTKCICTTRKHTRTHAATALTLSQPPPLPSPHTRIVDIVE